MDTAGIRLTLAGRPDAASTLVLVHGFGTDRSAWRHVAAAFDREHRIVTLDLVGATAESRRAADPDAYVDIERHAADLEAALDAAGLQRVTLVGHSIGGAVCAHVAARRPQRVAQLVLVGASARYQDAPGYVGGFATQDVENTYRAVAENHVGWAHRFAPYVMGRSDRPLIARDLACALAAVPPEWSLAMLRAIFELDLREDVARIDAPTLVIQSLDDPIVPFAAAQFLADRIPRSRLAVIDAYGHLPHLTHADAVVRAMQNFLAADRAAQRPSAPSGADELRWRSAESRRGREPLHGRQPPA